MFSEITDWISVMERVDGEKFVVTGGSGFIGSHICEELRSMGGKVWCIDLPDTDIINDHMNFNGASVVFHEACSKCTVCRDDPLNDLMTNAWGSAKVFSAAQIAGAKVVHASTGSVYGDNKTLPPQPYYRKGNEVRLDDPIFHDMQYEGLQYAPKSFYGVSKLAGEQYLQAFKEYYGLRFVGLRYFHVYGPRQNAGPHGGVVAIFITKMLRGEPIIIFGDGEQTRSFTYVKDVVRANFIAASSSGMEGDYFNVASGVEVSINDLVRMLEEIIGVKAIVEYASAKKGDIKFFDVCNDKIGEHGMNEWTLLNDGLVETVRWYRGNS